MGRQGENIETTFFEDECWIDCNRLEIWRGGIDGGGRIIGGGRIVGGRGGIWIGRIREIREWWIGI